MGGLWMACRDRCVWLARVTFSQARVGSRALFSPEQVRKEGEVSSWEDGAVLGRSALCTSWTDPPPGCPALTAPRPCRKPRAVGSWSHAGPGSHPAGVGHPCPQRPEPLPLREAAAVPVPAVHRPRGSASTPRGRGSRACADRDTQGPWLMLTLPRPGILNPGETHSSSKTSVGHEETQTLALPLTEVLVEIQMEKCHFMSLCCCLSSADGLTAGEPGEPLGAFPGGGARRTVGLGR